MYGSLNYFKQECTTNNILSRIDTKLKSVDVYNYDDVVKCYT